MNRVPDQGGKAILEDGRIVAIKNLNIIDDNNYEDFIDDVDILFTNLS